MSEPPATTGPGSAASSAAPPRRRGAPWTLRRRLVLVFAALLAAVSGTIGLVSVSVFHASAVVTVDTELRSASQRVFLQGWSLSPDASDVSHVLQGPGQRAGTLAAVIVESSGTIGAGYISEAGQQVQLDDETALTLASVTGQDAQTIDAGSGLGEYRALARDLGQGVRVVVALPLSEVTESTAQLALTIGLVALGGVLLALLFGVRIVDSALAPLQRMTETAQHVSELPLDREVGLAERVPVADDRTEVGRLGASFNRMLGHIGASLAAREHSEQQVRRFVADASHELRTPLASIRGYSEFVRLHGGVLPDEVRHATGRIESESRRMTELVEDLLLLARLDEGRELGRGAVELDQLLSDAVADAQIAGPGHDWSVELPGVPVVVAGDENRLRQVFANLLTNARVHTPEQTRVTARLAVADGFAQVTIADDGPGVPPELAPRLFERFSRGDSSRSRRAGSTGLGLAIVQAIVQAHGGSVEVSSEPGDTRFTVRLPA